MAPVTRRPAPAPSRPAPRTAVRPTARAAAAATGSSGYRGEEGRRKMMEEQDRAEARREANHSMSGAPFRFFCPVGETREIVVVDHEPDFFRHEHNLKDGQGRWSIYTSCINETANCPVCLSNPDKSAYFAMYLTIIDLTPYTNKDGVEVPWSKKLLVVKSQQQKKIMRYFERYGTLRGMVLTMTRDGDKDAAIGNDIEYVEHMDEDTLASYYNEYTSKDNKVIQVIGNEAFDYDEIFPEQTEEMLAAIVGGHVNNHDSHRRNIGADRRPGSSGDGWQEPPARGRAVSARPPARPAPSRPGPARPAPRGRAPAEEEAEAPEAVEGEEEAYEAPPVRGRAAPARPAPRGRAAPEAEEEYAEEDPPQRPSARPASRPAPRAAAPAAPATSLAAKRSALRGR